MFIPELGSGPLCMDHPPAVYTVCGSDLGADRGEWLLRAGSTDSAGHHPGLALPEDGAAPVGKHNHTSTHIMEHKYQNITPIHKLVIALMSCTMYVCACISTTTKI